MSDRGNVVRLRNQPALEPFRVTYVSELEGHETARPEWIVDGLFLRGTVAILGGQPGIGKSLLLEQLLTSIAVGADFLGRSTVQCRTFGMFCEDPQTQLELRQRAILAHLNRDAADLEMEASFQSRDTLESLLVEFGGSRSSPRFTDLWTQLWQFVEDDSINVVGIDTVATVFGGSEIDRRQVTAFMRELQRMAAAINGLIILTAHPSKSNANGLSGSNAWLASARTGLSLGRPADFDFETGEPATVRMLRGLKSNYSGGITAERIEYQDGVFVPADPDHTGPAKRGPLNHVERQDLKYRMLTGLKRNVLNGALVPADELDPRSLPSRARRQTDPSICKVALNDLYRAQQELLDGGLAVRVKVNGRVLIRAHDGPAYPDEEPYVAPQPATQ